MAADVAGYSRLIGEDEEGTLGALRIMRREVIDPAIAEHRGRIVKTTGDGLLAEFQSVVDALRCATVWQATLAERAGAIAWRIGIHQGDIVVEDGDIFGDGVNIAARLEALAEPGGLCVSHRVQEDAVGTLIDDVSALRQELGIGGKMHVFGGSWGGTLALAYAIAYPATVQTLILRGVF